MSIATICTCGTAFRPISRIGEENLHVTDDSRTWLGFLSREKYLGPVDAPNTPLGLAVMAREFAANAGCELSDELLVAPCLE